MLIEDDYKDKGLETEKKLIGKKNKNPFISSSSSDSEESGYRL